MPSDLVRAQSNALVRKVNVEVLSQADPNPSILRLARLVVQRSPEVRAVFMQVPVDRDRLTSVLRQHFPFDEGITEIAQYLADEYEQIGDGILLISTQTGKAIAKLSEEDFYLPAPVPRESGSMVQLGPKIRPEIEGFVIQWQHETHRECLVRDRMLSRIPQTELLREDGDRRILALSRAGRRNLVAGIQGLLPTLFQEATGIAGDFLSFFAMGKPPEESGLTALQVGAKSRVRNSIQDQLTLNLKYDLLTATLASVVTGWIRDIAGQLLGNIPSASLQSLPLKTVVSDRSGGLWVAEPNSAIELQHCGCRVLPTQGPRQIALYLRGPAGFLELQRKEPAFGSREVHDRWFFEAMTDAVLWVDFSRIEVFSVQGIDESGLSVEVI